MTDMKITEETLRYISLFEGVTKTHVKDCIENEEKLIFIVDKGQLGMAIGKSGETLKKLREMMKKNIDIIEYSPDPERFIKNIFHNYTVTTVKIDQKDGKKIATVGIDPKDKGKAIGKGGRNLKLAREIAARHHNVDSMTIA